ncbi:MAG: AIR synthase-related protein [Planctomycetota bacterium]
MHAPSAADVTGSSSTTTPRDQGAVGSASRDGSGQAAVHRIEVHTRDGHVDPRAAAVQRRAGAVLRDLASLFAADQSRAGAAPALAGVATADVYLIEAAGLDPQRVDELAHRLLADPVNHEAVAGVRPVAEGASLVEVHPLPGVMDPVAETVTAAIRSLFGIEATVLTGVRYDLAGVDAAAAGQIGERILANTLIQAVHHEPHWPSELPHGRPYQLEVRDVPLRDLDDDALQVLSREAHLFLSLDEMRAIRDYYCDLGREPRDIELETLAQTWSEHCVHKTLKSTITYRSTLAKDGGVAEDERSPNVTAVAVPGLDFPPASDAAGRPGHIFDSAPSSTKASGSPGAADAPFGPPVTIHNLLKSTVAAATEELMTQPGPNGEPPIDWCLSVFVDNSGVIAFDEETAVCFKVETHNHPSALEPYGGAATGVGGCVRDVIGTGLAAKPIASTDVFCVADPATRPQDVPAGCLPPGRILRRVVDGVRDYGNRMGIPTVNGAVFFDQRYIGNPLVYVGSVGVMPRNMIKGEPKPGDRIIAMGGATGRDGIHGATFSSAELTDTHADEFSHAVQIGNAITEKRVLDAILQARDHAQGCLFNAITDCGAGGFSSAVGEMGEHLGARVQLDRAPLKYRGLSYTEIWISEAQERMVLAVPKEHVDQLAAICDVEQVEWCDLGEFGTPDRELILNYGETEVGRMSMAFLHDGIPMPTREAVFDHTAQAARSDAARACRTHQMGAERDGHQSDFSDAIDALPPLSELRSSSDTGLFIQTGLRRLLGHPNIAVKSWIVREYDHEVQGRTVGKPLAGPAQRGPADAAVMLPRHDSTRGIAIANGLATGLAADPYVMALAAVDECVRNLVCAGADPSRIAILDNFCWPACAKPENLGSLVRAAEGCYDAAKAYRTPFISGKDSLNNQFTTEDGMTIEIPPTLLISGFGIVHDVMKHAITMDAKGGGSHLILVGESSLNLGGSHLIEYAGWEAGAASGDSAAHMLRRLPVLDLARGPKHARAVAGLIADGLVLSAHDPSEGGVLVAAAEMLAAAVGFGAESLSGAAMAPGDQAFGLDLNLDAIPLSGGHADGVVSDGELPLYSIVRAFGESAGRYLLEVADDDLSAVTAKLGEAGVGWSVIGRFSAKGEVAARLRIEPFGIEIPAADLLVEHSAP